MSLALLALLACAPQGGDVPKVLIKAGDTIDVLGQPRQVDGLGPAVAGIGGGWVAEAYSQGTPDTYLVGQRPSGLAGPIEVLRRPQTIAGYVQVRVVAPAMANGQIAYLSSETSSLPMESVWLEDQLLIQAGDPVQGHPGLTWQGFVNLSTSTSGRVLAVGLADGFSQGLVELPSGQTLLLTGDNVTGAGLPFRRFDSPIAQSSDGAHWTIAGRFGQTERALIVDGSVYRFPTGERARATEPVPAAVAAAGGTTWQLFQAPRVTSDGRVAFRGSRSSGGAFDLVVRDGLPVASGAMLYGLDERGFVITFGPSPSSVHVERLAIDRPSSTIDVDGDGLADPGWSAGSFRGVAAPREQALTLFFSYLTPPGGVPSFSIPAVLRSQDLRFDRPICSGVVNSTGSSAQMVTGGSSLAASNDVLLQAYQVPPTSVGYFLVSDTPGFTANPAGSQGNLCLSGAIGRMTSQLFVADVEGQVSAVFDTAAIPLPVGTTVATPGSTWFTQAWYRDSIGGTATSNFSGAVSFTFD